MRAVDTLAALIKPDASALQLRVATVSAISDPTLTINLAGTDVDGVARLASYAPVVGDTVLVLQTTAGLLVVLGRTA